MRKRDRLVLTGVVTFVVLVGGWMKVVSPERAKTTQVTSKVETARQQLQSAEAELSSAKTAQAKYTEAYAAMVKLGKAVPTDAEVAGLVYELETASRTKHVEFESITSGNSASGGSGPGAKAASAGAGFQAMPFTFVFNGSYEDLYHLLSTIEGLATYSPTSGLSVTGRLLTIQQIQLAPGHKTSEEGTTGKQSSSPGDELTGTITATAYVLPASVGLTGGATSSGPSGSPASGGGSGSGSAAATTATIKGTP